ncbi:hypothetical protein BDZ90DRAFT_230639 [Jaminaea rosea]|uniref:Splicing factor Cactin n=1 Tax=Jaminaea rosea TaxID=1569628 RepID=A0A316UX34_9BASI|nr:hypothetical protein BDZ90DRAFT_230639 [Jaminaea rosea]PWN29792.1 hypothetical protein BDZ90DRAFT_230639 [Jaminaea rosea]
MPRSASPPRRSRHEDEDRHSRHRSSRHYDDDADRARSSKSSRRHDDYDDDDRHASSWKRHRDDDRRERSSRRDRDDDRGDRKSSSHRHHHRDRDRKRSYDSDEEEERRRRRKDRKSRHRDETSQERRDRKAAKRSAHDQSEALERANVADMLMYSTGGGDNDFNDSDLSREFKWGKKQEKEKKMGLTPEEAARRDAERRREAQEEIARLNASRKQREAEQKIREEEEQQMARLAESAAMSEWVAKEDDFHLEQSRRRAAIRIRENRAKPIDLLAMNLRWADGDRIKAKRLDGLGVAAEEDEDDDEAGLEIDLEEPYEIFESLTLQDTEELYGDIQMYLELDKDERNLDFWRSMIIVCDDKLADLREAEQQGEDGDAGRPRMDPTIKANMNRMLAEKSYEDLKALQGQVRAKLRSDEAIDVEYWEGLLRQIVVWRAKAKLRDLHEVVLENRLEYLRRKQRHEAERQQEELVAQLGEEGRDYIEEADEAMQEEVAAAGPSSATAVASSSAWDPEEMEPRALDESRLNYDDRHLPVQTWDTLRADLIAARRKVLGASFVPRARPTNASGATSAEDAAEALFAQEAAKGIDVNESAFDDEAGLAPGQTMRGGGGRSAADEQTYDWEDKYRPRKPRYFNRVHTGFEWNKYNQTHYDSDNPPPKVVQGYKFNIFYPDLIDKSKAPTYRIIKEEGGGDETVILKFEAGAPYEDIAFRIVNRPWQYSHKRGFKSSFDRGVLQLYFNFQRNFYRK